MKLKKQKLLVDAMQDAFLDEAKQIEEEIKDVQLSENPIDKEKLRTAILTEAIETEQKENPRPKRKPMPKKIGQWAAILVMCMVGIFGFSMTSQGNRIFLVNKVEEFFGNKVNIQIDNKEAISNKNIEENVKDSIEKDLEISVPMFFYVPEGFEYLRYEVHPDAEVATMYYQYGEDNIITLQMFSNNGDYARGTSIDGDLTKSIKLVSEDLTVDLWTFENEINDDKAYCAQWMYKNTFYMLQGVIEEEVLEKILEGMHY